jgi:HEAT repeat protein
LNDSDKEVRRAAVEALGNLDDLNRAPPALIAALKDSDWEIREKAAESLGNIGDAAAVPGLGAAIHDERVEVRRKVIEALGQMEDSRVTTYLVTAIKDDDAEVRKAAAEALGEHKEQFLPAANYRNPGLKSWVRVFYDRSGADSGLQRDGAVICWYDIWSCPRLLRFG